MAEETYTKYCETCGTTGKDSKGKDCYTCSGKGKYELEYVDESYFPSTDCKHNNIVDENGGRCCEDCGLPFNDW